MWIISSALSIEGTVNGHKTRLEGWMNGGTGTTLRVYILMGGHTAELGRLGLAKNR